MIGFYIIWYVADFVNGDECEYIIMKTNKQKKQIRFLRAEIIACCVDVGFITQFFYIFLCLSIPMLADNYLVFVLGRIFGIYIVLAVEASCSLAALIIIRNSIVTISEILFSKLSGGKKIDRELSLLLTHILAAMLLILPGFVSDALGLLFLIPGPNHLIHLWFTRVYQHEFFKTSEYLASIMPTD